MSLVSDILLANPAVINYYEAVSADCHIFTAFVHIHPGLIIKPLNKLFDTKKTKTFLSFLSSTPDACVFYCLFFFPFTFYFFIPFTITKNKKRLRRLLYSSPLRFSRAPGWTHATTRLIYSVFMIGVGTRGADFSWLALFRKLSQLTSIKGWIHVFV